MIVALMFLLAAILEPTIAAGQPPPDHDDDAVVSADQDDATVIPADPDAPYGPAIVGEDGEVEVWRMPALAREDTFGVRLRYAMREVEIEGERVTLREIIRRAQEGEKRRREAIEDVQYTENVRAVAIGSRTKSDRRRYFEERNRVYQKPPDKRLHVSLASREYGDQDEKEEIKIRANVMVEVQDALNFANAPFYLEDIDAYRYEIVDRRVFPDRVVYAVSFEPRSEFDFEPSGTFWIDATDFVIIHEEMRFKKNPAPLILKSIDSIVRERRMVDGYLTVTRIQARVELRSALIFGVKAAELEVTYSEFAFNTGLDDSIFQGGSRSEAP